MTNRVKKHGALLRYLSKAKPSTCKSIIKTCDKELINVLCECALNVLNGNVRLNPTQRKRLVRYKNGLRAITVKKTALQKKKDLLQKGGFLQALLSPILGILGNLVGS